MKSAFTSGTLERVGAPDALQPNSRHCFACGVENADGLRLRFFNDGSTACRAEVVLHDPHQGYPGIAHGGVVTAILDEALTRAALASDFTRLMYTARIEVRFRQPVPLHTKLTVRGRVEKDRGRIVTSTAEIILPNGTVAAEANGTMVAVPEQALKEMDTPEAGWQVYPLDDDAPAPHEPAQGA
ncbi:MAG: PaaI family thioesterase [Chloroflexi bacterium CFX4]|nr:PaaI family thioesterase [Chloroflexi bacterium CFX4]MDL1924381.1 PaaI family thioesterase [Chloroflexi bacterium CFX3]